MRRAASDRTVSLSQALRSGALALIFSALNSVPTAFGAGASQTPVETPIEYLLALPHQPTVREIKDAFGGQLPNHNPFGNPSPQLEALISENAPEIIAKFEQAFPGATFAPLGRDSVFLGDILDAFYQSLSQNRITRLGASGDSRTGKELDLVDFLRTSGFSLENFEARPAFVFFDQTRWNPESQSRSYLDAVYRACLPPFCDRTKLVEKFNFINTGMLRDRLYTANELRPGFDIAGFLARRKSHLAENTQNLLDDIMSVKVAPELVYTEEYHKTFGAFERTTDGRVFARPGEMNSDRTRLQILANTYLAIQLASSPTFLAQVRLKAFFRGYAFPLERVRSSNQISRIRMGSPDVLHTLRQEMRNDRLLLEAFLETSVRESLRYGSPLRDLLFEIRHDHRGISIESSRREELEDRFSDVNSHDRDERESVIPRLLTEFGGGTIRASDIAHLVVKFSASHTDFWLENLFSLLHKTKPADSRQEIEAVEALKRILSENRSASDYWLGYYANDLLHARLPNGSRSESQSHAADWDTYLQLTRKAFDKDARSFAKELAGRLLARFERSDQGVQKTLHHLNQDDVFQALGVDRSQQRVLVAEAALSLANRKPEHRHVVSKIIASQLLRHETTASPSRAVVDFARDQEAFWFSDMVESVFFSQDGDKNDVLRQQYLKVSESAFGLSRDRALDRVFKHRITSFRLRAAALPSDASDYNREQFALQTTAQIERHLLPLFTIDPERARLANLDILESLVISSPDSRIRIDRRTLGMILHQLFESIDVSDKAFLARLRDRLGTSGPLRDSWLYAGARKGGFNWIASRETFQHVFDAVEALQPANERLRQRQTIGALVTDSSPVAPFWRSLESTETPGFTIAVDLVPPLDIMKSIADPIAKASGNGQRANAILTAVLETERLRRKNQISKGVATSLMRRLLFDILDPSRAEDARALRRLSVLAPSLVDDLLENHRVFMHDSSADPSSARSSSARTVRVFEALGAKSKLEQRLMADLRAWLPGPHKNGAPPVRDMRVISIYRISDPRTLAGIFDNLFELERRGDLHPTTLSHAFQSLFEAIAHGTISASTAAEAVRVSEPLLARLRHEAPRWSLGIVSGNGNDVRKGFHQFIAAAADLIDPRELERTRNERAFDSFVTSPNPDATRMLANGETITGWLQFLGGTSAASEESLVELRIRAIEHILDPANLDRYSAPHRAVALQLAMTPLRLEKPHVRKQIREMFRRAPRVAQAFVKSRGFLSSQEKTLEETLRQMALLRTSPWAEQTSLTNLVDAMVAPKSQLESLNSPNGETMRQAALERYDTAPTAASVQAVLREHLEALSRAIETGKIPAAAFNSNLETALSFWHIGDETMGAWLHSRYRNDSRFRSLWRGYASSLPKASESLGSDARAIVFRDLDRQLPNRCRLALTRMISRR